MLFVLLSTLHVLLLLTPQATATSWDALRDYVCAQQCPGGVRDVVIVGAGAAGLYSGWRLKSALPDSSIAVIEAEQKIGGRLFSVKVPGMPHLTADLGAMHYVDDPKTFLNAWLVDDHFKLPSRAFHGNMSDEQLPVMLRNVRFRLADLKNATAVAEVGICR